jgi:hypothetical protein
MASSLCPAKQLVFRQNDLKQNQRVVLGSNPAAPTGTGIDFNCVRTA